jgi:hypothetical protein
MTPEQFKDLMEMLGRISTHLEEIAVCVREDGPVTRALDSITMAIEQKN